jgi:hypothetical protein
MCEIDLLRGLAFALFANPGDAARGRRRLCRH